MEHNDKTKKAIAELVTLLVEGEKRLEKYRRTAVRVKLGCLGLTFIAIAIAVFPPHVIAITSALLGIAGGVCLGIALMYDSSLLTWPIGRPLLDEEAVQRFISENKG
jgi:hypothetical protein